jgi:hypothetical protein
MSVDLTDMPTCPDCGRLRCLGECVAEGIDLAVPFPPGFAHPDGFGVVGGEGEDPRMSMLYPEPADQWGNDEPPDDADICCVCGKPSVGYYRDREDCPSCGRPRCELRMQAGLDEEVGDR